MAETIKIRNKMTQQILYAFLLSLIAGLTTVLGGCITFFLKKESFKILSLGLSFSAGVMIYVSFMEVMPSANEVLSEKLDPKAAMTICTLLFFWGVLFSALIDLLFPEHVESKDLTENSPEKKRNSIRRLGVFSAIALSIHNFPEGLSVFVSSVESLKFGLPISIAIALHNIPEGVSVALPIYNSTGSRKKAILWSFASGMAEPVGALLGFFAVQIIMPQYAVGTLLSFTAGVMVYLSIDELLPTAKEYEDGHETIIGFVLGMALMAVSLLLLA